MPIELIPAFNVPPETVVPPVYVFAPANVKTPAPVLLALPVPEMMPFKVMELPALKVFAPVNATVPFQISPEPLVPCNVPPLSVKLFESVLRSVKSVAPVPTVIAPVPKAARVRLALPPDKVPPVTVVAPL